MKLSDQYTEAPVQQAESLGAGVEATELIVHGVGGALPSDLLDDHHPTRVSGDHLAGFYRPQTGPARPSARGSISVRSTTHARRSPGAASPRATPAVRSGSCSSPSPS